MPEVSVWGIRKTYGDVQALISVELSISDGELLAVVGPSGGGKTTLLRLIAGLDTPSEGVVAIGRDDLTADPPARRGVSMLFQRAALYPRGTVRHNLVFHRRLQRADGRLAQRRELDLDWLAQLLDLDALLDRYPWQLSGGQQQRVALARALIRPATAYLLDEPFSHLDAPRRLDLRRQLHLLQRRFPATMILVTHDPVEALALGDRVAVLDAGRIRQIGVPRELWQHPNERGVAELLCPLMNFVTGRLLRGADRLVLTRGETSWPAPPAWAPHVGREVAIGVEPESATLAPDGQPMDVELVEAQGSGWLVRCAGPLGRIPAMCRDNNPPKPGDKVMVKLDGLSLLLFDGVSGVLLEGRTA